MNKIESNTPRAEIIVRPTDLGGVPTILVRESLVRAYLDKGIIPVITVGSESLPPRTMPPRRVLVVAPVVPIEKVKTLLLRNTFMQVLIQHNLIPVVIPGNYPLDLALELLRESDGLLLTGGSDIDPTVYGQKKEGKTDDADTKRDETEIILTKTAIDEGLPFLGLCRGAQMLNVALGGELIQLVDHENAKVYGELANRQLHHNAQVIPNTLAWQILAGEEQTRSTVVSVNSAHHQAINPDHLGKDLVVSMVSLKEALKAVMDEHNKVIGYEIVHDRIVEAIERIFGFALGLQFHAEADPNMDPFFAVFAQAIMRR